MHDRSPSFDFECPGKALSRTSKGFLQVYMQQILTPIKTLTESTLHNQKLRFSKEKEYFHVEF